MMNKQYMRSVKEISVLIISNMQKAVNLRLITLGLLPFLDDFVLKFN